MLKTSINSSTIKYRFKYKLNKDNSELLDNSLFVNFVTKALNILTVLCQNKKILVLAVILVKYAEESK